MATLLEDEVIFPTKDDEAYDASTNKTYDIFDIHRRLLYFDEREKIKKKVWNKTGKMLKCTDPSDN